VPDTPRLMAVLAHPDDESLGVGGTLARYAREGVETYVVTATRGERGRFHPDRERPSDDEVGRVRELELRRAAEALGVREVSLLGYLDGELDRADPEEATRRVAAHIRRVRPHVVITFDPFGGYGHPDHVAISQFTAAAVQAAAEPVDARSGQAGGERPGDAAREPWAVSKLYYFVFGEATWEVYQAAFKRLVSTVDGVEREAVAWPDWAISAHIDTRAEWERVWRAVSCHETQIGIYETLADLTPEHHEALWGSQTFYRAMSRVNGGRRVEDDLFEGIR